MLKNLRIRNFAIIDDLSIEFDKGFNVFTGETGAGKSIIFNALSLLFKGRSDSSLIKTGKDKAIIEGVFEIKDENIKNILNEQDIDYDDELIIKRVIGQDNHNSIKINESNVTLNFLMELLNKYIDIHSQKDSQLLYNKAYQLSLLDKYINNEDLLKQYDDAYLKYLKVNNEYNELLNNNYNEREIEFYKYDLNELLEANLDIKEEDELELLEKRYKDIEKYINIKNNISNLYNSNSGIKEKIYDLINELNVDDEIINKYKETIKDIYYSLDENINGLIDDLNDLDDKYLNIESIEERLYIYNKLKRKHKCDTKALIALQDDLKAKIAAFEDRDVVLNEKLKEVNIAKEIALKIATEISNKRKSYALKLQEAILKETKDLLLNNCTFKIQIDKCDLNHNGIDDVEFLVSMNLGEDLKPLRNVASGGEMSRLMLALKSIFSSISTVDLLILDEIDTGVSGNIALAVGEKIAKISKNIQVLCISHLSPVAACANSHYLIYKEDDEKETKTSVKKLNKEEIIEELAAISNTNKNSKAYDAALELYNTAQQLTKEL